MLRPSAACSADRAGPVKHRQLPSARHHVVSQDVAGAVVAADLEVAMIRRQPCVENFDDLDDPAAERQSPRCLFAAMTGVAFDPDFEGGGRAQSRLRRDLMDRPAILNVLRMVSATACAFSFER